MRSGFSAMCYKVFSEGLSWGRNEIEVFLIGVRNSLAMARGSVHSYHKLYVVYGRRPSVEEEASLKGVSESHSAPAQDQPQQDQPQQQRQQQQQQQQAPQQPEHELEQQPQQPPKTPEEVNGVHL